MNKFEEAEEIGRQLFVKRFKNNYKWIAFFEDYTTIDGFFELSGDTNEKYIMEIKNRSSHSLNSYPTWVLEDNKATSLFNAYKDFVKLNKNLKGALYVVILKDCMLIWDITKTDIGPIDTSKKMPKHTMSQQKEYKNKENHYLKPDDAKWKIDI